MLTQIRRIQKGTLIVVTVIIVIAFAFLYSDFDFVKGSVGKQNCVVKVYNRCYRQKEAQKLGSNFDVALRLGMYDFATVLFGENRKDRDPTDFIMSLVILRTEAEKMGIEPTAEEIKEAIPKLPVFQQPFVDANFVKNNILGPNGFSEGDLAQLVKDYLSFQKLRNLIGAGVSAVPSETDRIYIRGNQRYTASVINFDRKELVEKIKISDTDVKTYYGENKETLNSDPKRGFDYVHFIPQALPEEVTNEQRAKSELNFANAVNRAYSDLAEDGADFKAVAKQYSGKKADFSLELKELAPFSPASPPAFAKEDEAMLRVLFSNALPMESVTVPIASQDGGYYVFHYMTQIEPQQLTLEAATPAIREKLIAQKSNSAVNEAANVALASIRESITAGKSFPDAVAKAGLKADALPNFSEAEPPAGTENSALILEAVEGLGERELSGVIDRPGGAGVLLVYVDKLELYKDEEEASAKTSIAASSSNQLDRTLFSAWFNQRRAESGSERADLASAQ